MKFKKVYVAMIVKITKDGSLRPLSMVWEDGATYEIDRVECIRVMPDRKLVIVLKGGITIEEQIAE